MLKWRIAKDIGCPLFVIDEWKISELNRWKDLYMVEYYRANPDKAPWKNHETITIEESERQLMDFLGCKEITEIGG